MRFAFDDQIASQPDAVAALLGARDLPRLDPRRPVIFTGIGSSLHACRVAAGWLWELSGGELRAQAVDAHELSLRLPLRREDQLVVVTHKTTRGFPGRALAKARAAGSATLCIAGQGAPEPEADAVLRTCADETSGTHSVSYTTALVRLAQLVGPLCGLRGDRLLEALRDLPALLQEAIALPPPVEAARKLAGRRAVLVAGDGLDAVLAQEGALKLKEGALVWAEGMSIEGAIHGPLAALDGSSGAVTITPAAADAGRAEALREALSSRGVAQVRCGPDDELPFPRCEPLLRPLVGAVPLQRLAAEVARLAGTNPDQAPPAPPVGA